MRYVLEIRFTRRLLTGWSEGNMALGTGSIQHGIEHLVGRGDESNLQLSPEGLLGALHSCSFDDCVDELDGVESKRSLLNHDGVMSTKVGILSFLSARES